MPSKKTGKAKAGKAKAGKAKEAKKPEAPKRLRETADRRARQHAVPEQQVTGKKKKTSKKTAKKAAIPQLPKPAEVEPPVGHPDKAPVAKEKQQHKRKRQIQEEPSTEDSESEEAEESEESEESGDPETNANNLVNEILNDKGANSHENAPRNFKPNSKPHNFSGEPSEETFENWITDFEASYHGADMVTKGNALSNYLVGKARKWFSDSVPTDKRHNYSYVKEKLTGHFGKSVASMAVALEKFKQRVQGPTEDARTVVADLRGLWKQASNIGENEMLVDLIISKLSPLVRFHLDGKKFATVDDIIKHLEDRKELLQPVQMIQLMQSLETTQTDNVNAVRETNLQGNKFQFDSRGKPLCTYCNKPGHLRKECWRLYPKLHPDARSHHSSYKRAKYNEWIKGQSRSDTRERKKDREGSASSVNEVKKD